jgi:hypothetical protein
MIKTFRGLLADGGQDRIRLQTIKGKVGYRIVKFQVMPKSTGSGSNEGAITIWKNSQSSASQDVDFTDSDLLAAAYFLRDQGTVAITSETIIFDSEIFNQDIYIDYQDAQTSGGDMNYYFELEVIPLDDAGAEYTTLKDMRSS